MLSIYTASYQWDQSWAPWHLLNWMVRDCLRLQKSSKVACEGMAESVTGALLCSDIPGCQNKPSGMLLTVPIFECKLGCSHLPQPRGQTRAAQLASGDIQVRQVTEHIRLLPNIVPEWGLGTVLIFILAFVIAIATVCRKNLQWLRDPWISCLLPFIVMKWGEGEREGNKIELTDTGSLSPAM